jgi:hypothetical protein
MTVRSTILAASVFSLAELVLTGCGAIGDLQPPTLDIPRPVSDLRVIQRGDKVVIDFTIPELTTEGLELRLAKVELKAGDESLETTGMKPGPEHLEMDAARWKGQEVLFRVRLVSHKNRDSGWSEDVALRVIPPLATPAGLRADAVPEGVRLTWTGPDEPAGVGFRVRRRTGTEAVAELATVRGREWTDTDTQYGTDYEYTLQTVVADGSVRAQSAVIPAVQITPTDRFPPSVPKGLSAIAGSASFELAWDPSPAADLRGYVVYRSSGDQPWQKVSELTPVPSYSDRDVKPGASYRYAVSAVDSSANESDRSAAIEVTLP